MAIDEAPGTLLGIGRSIDPTPGTGWPIGDLGNRCIPGTGVPSERRLRRGPGKFRRFCRRVVPLTTGAIPKESSSGSIRVAAQ
jgi:hypothetical protein